MLIAETRIEFTFSQIPDRLEIDERGNGKFTALCGGKKISFSLPPHVLGEMRYHERQENNWQLKITGRVANFDKFKIENVKFNCSENRKLSAPIEKGKYYKRV